VVEEPPPPPLTGEQYGKMEPKYPEGRGLLMLDIRGVIQGLS